MSAGNRDEYTILIFFLGLDRGLFGTCEPMGSHRLVRRGMG